MLADYSLFSEVFSNLPSEDARTLAVEIRAFVDQLPSMKTRHQQMVEELVNDRRIRWHRESRRDRGEER
jgi:hypothetical protein